MRRLAGVHVADSRDWRGRVLRIYVRGRPYDEFVNPDPAYVIGVARDIGIAEHITGPVGLPRSLEEFRP